jgi:hypothetical protein
MGNAQQTPDLSTVIQEIVNRSGWQNGNSAVLIFTDVSSSTSKKRTSESYESMPNYAPILTTVFNL